MRDRDKVSLFENIIFLIKNNIEIDDIYSEHEIIEFIKNNKPEEVFEDSVLEDWAERNGFIKEE